jgi:hypothetical protein
LSSMTRHGQVGPMVTITRSRPESCSLWDCRGEPYRAAEPTFAQEKIGAADGGALSSDTSGSCCRRAKSRRRSPPSLTARLNTCASCASAASTRSVRRSSITPTNASAITPIPNMASGPRRAAARAKARHEPQERLHGTNQQDSRPYLRNSHLGWFHHYCRHLAPGNVRLRRLL